MSFSQKNHKNTCFFMYIIYRYIFFFSFGQNIKFVTDRWHYSSSKTPACLYSRVTVILTSDGQSNGIFVHLDFLPSKQNGLHKI